jgi:hypothetical protein
MVLVPGWLQSPIYYHGVECIETREPNAVGSSAEIVISWKDTYRDIYRIVLVADFGAVIVKYQGPKCLTLISLVYDDARVSNI